MSVFLKLESIFLFKSLTFSTFSLIVITFLSFKDKHLIFLFLFRRLSKFETLIMCLTCCWAGPQEFQRQSICFLLSGFLQSCGEGGFHIRNNQNKIMAEENLRNKMIIRKNKRQFHGDHGPHTESQKLARLGEVEGRDRNFKLGSIPSVLFSLTLSNGRLPYGISHSENSA